MSAHHERYGHINNESDMRLVFTEIRDEVANAGSRPTLTELYRRAGYLITLTYAPSWAEKFGAEAPQLRKIAEDEFHATAEVINRRATHIGTPADYRESWGER